jgi:hypothetical protein
MRWTRQRRACLRLQGEMNLVSDRTAHETSDAVAYGEAVWSWHPLLMPSLRRRSWPNRASGAANSQMTVTKGIRRRGERGVSRKAIARGMSECSPLPCMLVCANAQSLGTRDRGCSAHPAFPAPSVSRVRTKNLDSSGKTCRENEHVCFRVIASEAKQSTYPLAAPWIASSQALLALTAGATPSLVIAREGGRSSIPEATVIDPRGRGVLDAPPSRGMTALGGSDEFALRPSNEPLTEPIFTTTRPTLVAWLSCRAVIPLTGNRAMIRSGWRCFVIALSCGFVRWRAWEVTP